VKSVPADLRAGEDGAEGRVGQLAAGSFRLWASGRRTLVRHFVINQDVDTFQTDLVNVQLIAQLTVYINVVIAGHSMFKS
jgi:hypothetical protein